MKMGLLHILVGEAIRRSVLQRWKPSIKQKEKLHTGISSIANLIQMPDKLPTKQKSSIITFMMLLKKSLSEYFL